MDDNNDIDMLMTLDPVPPPDDDYDMMPALESATPPYDNDNDNEMPEPEPQPNIIADGGLNDQELQPGFEEHEYEEHVRNEAFKLWKKQRGALVIEALGKFKYCLYSSTIGLILKW
jgi:hypothetical protein